MVRLTAIAEQGKTMAEETKILYRHLIDMVSVESKANTIQALVKIVEHGIDRSQDAQTTCGIMAMDFMEQKISLTTKEDWERLIPFRTGSASAGINLVDDMSRGLEVLAKTCKDSGLLLVYRTISDTSNGNSKYPAELVGLRGRRTQSALCGQKDFGLARSTRNRELYLPMDPSSATIHLPLQ
jgi:hypothetical protein